MDVSNEERMHLRTVISEQDFSTLQTLRFLLSSEPLIDLVSECRDLNSTRSALEQLRPDLLIANVHIFDGKGRDALSALNSEDAPIVVLIGRREHLPIANLEAHALDFLTPPLESRRVHSAVECALLEFFRKSGRKFTTQLLTLLKMRGAQDSRSAIRVGGRIVFLNVDEIEYIEAAANYVNIHTGRSSYKLREAIGSLATRLDRSKFGRIHRSFIVNVEQLKELEPCGSGQYMAILKSGKELPCSRKYRSAIESLSERRL